MISCCLLASALMIFPVGQSSAQTSGETYSPKNGNFTIRFPGSPKETTQKSKSPLGEVDVFTATYSTNNGNVFMVSYSDLPDKATKPENLKSLFEGVRDGVKGKDGKITDDEEFLKENGVARGHKIDVVKGDQTVKIWVIVRGNRLYQVAAIGTPKFVNNEGIAFLESFQTGK